MDSVLSRTEARTRHAAAVLRGMTLEEKQDLLDEWCPMSAEDPGWELLPSSLQKAISEDNTPVLDADASEYEPILHAAIFDQTVGVRNEWLQTELDRLGVGSVQIVGKPEPMCQCPCCGFASLRERGTYEVCQVCFWEDDGSDDEDRYSGPNHMLLREGRSNFGQFGSCDEKFIGAVLTDASLRYHRTGFGQ